MKHNERYLKLVKEAKALVVQRDLVQMKIAKIAVEVCTIRHGGKSSGLYTLSDFARDIGVPFKSLSRWTITYRTIVSKIPEEIKTEADWNKAANLSEKMTKDRNLINKINGNHNSKNLLKVDEAREKKEILEAFKNMNENTKALQYANEGLTRALYNLNRIDSYPKDDEKYLLSINSSVAQFIELATRIQQRTICLMGRIEK